MSAPRHPLSRAAEPPTYTTKDGSRIRELMHPAVHGNHAQSLAEARVEPGMATLAHRHQRSEELYHVTAGHGQVRIDSQRYPLAPGDTVAIPPGSVHALENHGDLPLVVLCCCSPPYAHEDTELVE